MKYASEVIGLMAAHPDREFRMAQIVRYVDPIAKGCDRQRVHKGVLRVLKSLSEHGQIEIKPAIGVGGFAMYSWKVRHQVLENRDRNYDNRASTIAP